MTRSFKYVCLGGGNSAGYLAKELVAAGLQPGELCIITDEPVSGTSASVKASIPKCSYAQLHSSRAAAL
jgi:hypothetical protein